MLSVLIADDERVICFLIQKLIHWDELEMKLVGCAGNGEEAYRMALELHPDIVITDIQMPIMSGLELIEKVQAELPETSFIIISGYQEFEYAKQAIRFGAWDYLLKPIKERELNGILEQIRKKREEDTSRDNEMAILRQEKGKARRRWLDQLVNEKSGERSEEDSLPFAAEACCLIQIYVDPHADMESAERAVPVVAEKVKNSFWETFPEMALDSDAVISPAGRISILWNRRPASGNMRLREPENAAADEQERRERYRDFLNRSRVKYSSVSIRMAVSPWLTGAERLPETVAGMNRLMRARGWLDRGDVLYPERFPEVWKTESAGLSRTDRLALLRMIDSKKEEETWSWLHTRMEAMRRNDMSCPFELFDFLETLHDELEGVFRELGLWNAETAACLNRWRKQEAFYHSYGKINCEVRRLLHEIFELREKNRQEMENRPVKQAKTYVREHFAEAVTMEKVAELVGLNSAYFSSLFKKSEGMNFTEYLAQVRIQAAKEYLAGTRLNMAEIASRVGYSDVRYFSKVFIKAVGIRPGEYRKIHA